MLSSIVQRSTAKKTQPNKTREEMGEKESAEKEKTNTSREMEVYRSVEVQQWSQLSLLPKVTKTNL